MALFFCGCSRAKNPYKQKIPPLAEADVQKTKELRVAGLCVSIASVSTEIGSDGRWGLVELQSKKVKQK